jgi:TonB family protein
MVSTISSVSVQTKPKLLVEAIGGFAGGALSLKEVRQVISNEIKNNPSCGGIIHEMLEEELQARRLSVADHNELMAGIDAALSENLPTETSGEAPSASGIYHLDDEGTLVLSDDGQRFQTPKEAYDSVDAPGSKSKANKNKTQQQRKPAEIKAGSILRERFRLDKEIARGSMGVVYKAVDMLKQEAGAADPCVAVKLISPEFVSHRSALKTFQNEIANTQHLSHPNIIHLFELDRDGGNYFITMEWLEGESLDTLLDRSQGSALPPVQTYAIIEQLCDALAYAHERNVVHADVKPGNVFLVKTGELKLIDFGIARVDASLKDDARSKKESLEVALTPAYASCERLETADPTAQDDLYALACMIYRLLSGRRVFGAMHALEAEKANIEPVRIGGMSDVRWNALRLALSFRRQFRQASVNEFASKFGPRRTPLAIEPEEDEHTETTTLGSLPAGSLESDMTKLEALDEAAKLQNLAGSGEMHDSLQAPELAVDIGDAFDIDLQTLDEFPDLVEPQVLAGADPLQNVSQAPASSDDSVDADKNILHVDIAGLNAQPDFELFGSASQDEEVPFVDTVNLDAAPEPINIFDGDGTGFLPEADPADSVSVPADEPPQRSAKTVPAPKVKQAGKKAAAKKGTVKKAKAASVEKASPRHKEKVTRQLSGGSQRQVAERSGFAPLTLLLGKPQLVVGSLLGVIVVMIGIGFVMSFDKSEPIVLGTSSQQSSAPVQKTLPIQMNEAAPDALADIETGETVMLDLTASVEQASVADDSGFEVVAIDLSDSAEKPAEVDATDPDAVPVVLAQPVGMVQNPSPSDVISDSVQQAADVPVQKSEPQKFQAQKPTAQKPQAQKPQAQKPQAQKPTAQKSAAPKPVSPAPVAASVPVTTAKPTQTKASAGVSRQVPADTDFAPPVNAPVEMTPDRPKAPASVEEQAVANEVTNQVNESVAAKAPAAPVTKSPLELHSNARKALAEGRLVQPGNDNAAYWLKQMRDEGGNVPALIAIESKLANALIQRAEDTYIAGDLYAAQGWIDLAERNGANEDELAPLLSAIARMKSDEAAALAVPGAQTTQSSRAAAKTAATGQAGIGPYQRVALSNFEFVNYVEPEYPTQAIGGSVTGWVDVAFTVGKDGKPRNVRVIGSDLPDRFEAPSVAAVKRWRLEPYAPSGQPLVVNSAVRLGYSE